MRKIRKLFVRKSSLIVALGIVALGFVLSFGSNTALAVQSVSVQGDTAQVFAQPGSSAEVVDDVPGGTKLPASSKPTRGYYKVKTPGGKIGWMSAESLGLPATAEAAPGDAAVSPPPPAPVEETRPARRATRSSSQSSSRRSSSMAHTFGIKAFGGMTMFKLDTINTAYGITELSTGIGFGAELNYRFSPHLTGLFRFETLSKSVEVQVTSKSELFTLKAAATPIETGVKYGFMEPKDSFQLGFAGLLGFGIGSKFSSIAEGAAAPNETIYSGSPLVIHFKLDADYFLASSFSLGLELGYRIHKIAAAVPTTAGNTTSTDPLWTKVGTIYSPEEINLGGLTLGTGFTFWF